MKQVGLFLIAMALLSCSESPKEAAQVSQVVTATVIENTFRKTVWRMSKQQVIAIEGEPYYQPKNVLLYNGVNVGGKDAVVMYVFHANKLVKGFYIFGMKNTMKSEFVRDFNDVFPILESKYGAPDVVVEVWVDSLSQEKYKGRYGSAVANCSLKRKCIWNTEHTTISQFLMGSECSTIDKVAVNSKSQIQHVVEYASTEIDNIKANNSEEKAYSTDF